MSAAPAPGVVAGPAWSARVQIAALAFECHVLRQASALLAPAAKCSSKAFPRTQVDFPALARELARARRELQGEDPDRSSSADERLQQVREAAQEARELARELDSAVEPAALRRHLLAEGVDGAAAARALLPYYLLLAAPSPEQRDKVDLLVTRLAFVHGGDGAPPTVLPAAAVRSAIDAALRYVPSAREDDRDESSVLAVEGMLARVMAAPSLDDLVRHEIPQAVRALKAELGPRFHRPAVLAAIAELNAHLTCRFEAGLRTELCDAVDAARDGRSFEELLLEGDGSDVAQLLSRAREAAREHTPLAREAVQPAPPAAPSRISIDTYLGLIGNALAQESAGSRFAVEIPAGPTLELDRWEVDAFTGEEAGSKRAATVREAVAAWAWCATQLRDLAEAPPLPSVLAPSSELHALACRKERELQRLIDAEMIDGNMFLARKLTLTKGKLETARVELQAAIEAQGGTASTLAARHPAAVRVARVAVETSRKAALALALLAPLWLALGVRAYLQVHRSPTFDVAAMSTMVPVLSAILHDGSFDVVVGDEWAGMSHAEKTVCARQLFDRGKARGARRIVVRDPTRAILAQGDDTGVTVR